MNDKVKILVCCHKADVSYSDDIYLPIHVGKALSDEDLGIQGDDTGDNISAKNASFCELTGLYWAWKNLKDVDYIGLCHYRRYFNFNEKGTFLSHRTIIPSEKLPLIKLSLPVLSKIFSRHKAIIAKRRFFQYSMYVEYCTVQSSSDFRKLTDVINELYPEYSYDWERFVYYSNGFSCYNMFVMSRERLDHYCKWLFDILFEVEKRIDISAYDDSQKRVFGYLGEYLLFLYVKHNRMNPKYYPIYFISETLLERSILKRIRKRISHTLLTAPRYIDGILKHIGHKIH